MQKESKLRQSMFHVDAGTVQIKKKTLNNGQEFIKNQFPNLNHVQIKNKRIPKNNSFDEKSSPIKAAMAASLAADDDDEGSLTRFTR